MSLIAVSLVPTWRGPLVHVQRARHPRHPPPVLGVPGFSSWLDVHFATSRSEVPEDFSADVVAFDMNSVAHAALRNSRDETHAIKLIFQRLHATLRCVRPERYVLLALDGPGPMAKMATQHKSRLKTSTKKSKRGISPLRLTPGTAFMAKLEESLTYFACSEASTYRGRQLRYLVSGSDAPGEGEFKIMDWLLSHHEAQMARDASRAAGPGGGRRLRSVVMVGSDGDLVLQALSMQARSLRSIKLYVLRSVPSAKVNTRTAKQPSGALKAVTRRRHDDGLPLVRVDELRTQTLRWLDGDPRTRRDSTLPRKEADSAILDLVALSCLMGSDYLPKVRGATFDRVWCIYGELQRHPAFQGQRLFCSDRQLNTQLLSTLLRLVAATASLGATAANAIIERGVPVTKAKVATSRVGLDKETLHALAVEAIAAAAKGAELPAPDATDLAASTAAAATAASAAVMAAASEAIAASPDVAVAAEDDDLELIPELESKIVGALTRLRPRALASVPVQDQPGGVADAQAKASDTDIEDDEDAEEEEDDEEDEEEEEEEEEDDDDDEDDEDDEEDTADDAGAEAADTGEGPVQGLLRRDGKRMRGRDPTSYVAGLLWTVQLFADGVCPDFEWQYQHAFAPGALELASYLDSVADDETALQTPSSREPPLPAPLVCAIMLPREQVIELGPAALVEQLQPGGKLAFVHPPSPPAAPHEVDEELEPTGPSPPPPPPPPPISRRELLEVATELPAELVGRSTALSRDPAWLAVRSVASGKQRGGAARRGVGATQLAERMPPLSLPPRPPDGMRELQTGRLQGEWVLASRAPRQRPRPWSEHRPPLKDTERGDALV